MVTGDRKYLEAARRALAFLREKGWDEKHGGFHATLNRRGDSIDLTRANPVADQKWSFWQHYALLGVAAVYDAGRAPEDLAFLLRGRRVIDEKLWDPRPGFEGYFETADHDWAHPREKGFTPTVDGITTHGLALYLLTRDEAHRTRLLALADAIVERLLPTARTRKLGFAEKFDSDWRETQDGFFFVGHVLKAAWCLNRAYMVEPRPEYLAGAEELLRQVRATAWDDRHGGPYYAGDSRKGQLTGFEKNWWTLEQAITAGLTGWHLTGNLAYLQMADESADFFARHLVDPEHGDAYESSNASGAIVRSRRKGHYWKAGYHTLETGWFVYLYGNLFHQRRPVTLHYAIEPAPVARTMPLDPIAMEAGTLVIQEVRLDGQPYAAFDGAARTLTVPAGVGGEFRVTFAPVPVATGPR
jgi:mannobiose 2-epimerase